MANKKFQFHYTPTGTGVISGPEVLQQTEDAINNIGQYADQASDNSEEALSIAKEARQTAQTANSTSSNALAEANAANEKVETLKQTVDDWDADIQTAIAQSKSAVDASTIAVNTANTAQTSASSAQSAAQGSAASAQTAANNAAQAVQTSQAAQQAAQTAQGNAEAAQTAATTAQTAAQTAETKALEAAASAYAVRVINQVLTVSGTIQIADLKPQGNIKAGDTVVGTDGRMFTIASVDSSAGTALLSADYTDLTPSVSYQASQSLSTTQQQTARDNIAFGAGVNAWADSSFDGRVDDYVCPILEELILENGGTQEEIDDAKNAAESETPATN